MPGPGIDKRHDDDALTIEGGVPFIADSTFMNQYGSAFELLFEGGRLSVRPSGRELPIAGSCS